MDSIIPAFNPLSMIEQKRLEQLTDHNKRLKICIKWFQRVEENNLLEQEKLRNALECSEKKCSDTGKW